MLDGAHVSDVAGAGASPEDPDMAAGSLLTDVEVVDQSEEITTVVVSAVGGIDDAIACDEAAVVIGMLVRTPNTRFDSIVVDAAAVSAASLLVAADAGEEIEVLPSRSTIRGDVLRAGSRVFLSVDI